VATTPYAEINGDLVTIHGVRNFDYRSESDFAFSQRIREELPHPLPLS
jgi:hypothetical protein